MISKEEVQKLAELARLELSDAEVTSLQKDMTDILGYVGQVSAVSGEEESVVPVRNVFREDIPRDAEHLLSGKEHMLREAFPSHKNGYNVVRKIIQKDE